LFAAAKLGGDWLVSRQQTDGRIPAWTNTGRLVTYTDVSAVAQAVRIWSVLFSETGDSKYTNAVDKSLDYLLKMQKGGFYLAELDLKISKHKFGRLYSWATIFAMHALQLADDLRQMKISGSQLW
jgi:hypothetical protein